MHDMHHDNEENGAAEQTIFSEVTFPNESIRFLCLTWAQLEAEVFSLAQKISNHTSLHPIDRIITLAKGGWPMARSLSDFLGGVPVASFGVRTYDGISNQSSDIAVYQALPPLDPSEHILLFDDIADTGQSLQFTLDHLKEQGVTQITTATVFFKPHSSIQPDFYSAETVLWVIFPYEFQETVYDLSSRWKEQGIEMDEIASRLHAMQFNPRILKAILAKI